MFNCNDIDFTSFLPHPVLLVYFLLILPTALTVSESASVQFEFPAFRLQQYDLATVPLGTRHTSVSCEATSLSNIGTTLRRCAIVGWRELIGVANIESALNDALGAVLILLPADLNTLTEAEAQSLAEIEHQLVTRQFAMAVYFARGDDQLRAVHRQLQHDKQTHSALAAVLDGIASNSYQLVSTTSPTPAPLLQHNNIIVCVCVFYIPFHRAQGRLDAAGSNVADAPTIVIVAHYDSFAAAPALSLGADSNGSGVAGALELLRILHKFYADTNTRPHYNVVVVLSAVGKFGYQGTRHWIEQHWQRVNNAGSSASSGGGASANGIHFALCLDALGADAGLNMHVSKTPSDKSPIYRFHQRLQYAARLIIGNQSEVPIVSKKINLADTLRSWEHERFSMERLPAFTLSHLSQSTDYRRRALSDTFNRINQQAFVDNVQVIAHALVHYMYDIKIDSNTNDSQSMNSALVRQSQLIGWLRRLTNGESRAVQHVSNGAVMQPIVKDLYAAVVASSHHAAYQSFSLTAKDADVVVHSVSEVQLAVYETKPAIFDLVLAAGIAAYLGVIYYAVMYASWMVSALRSTVASTNKAYVSNGKHH